MQILKQFLYVIFSKLTKHFFLNLPIHYLIVKKGFNAKYTLVTVFASEINWTRRQVGVNSGLIKLGEEPVYEVDITSCKGWKQAVQDAYGLCWGHRIIRYRMRALSRDRGPIWQKNVPFRV